MSIRKSIFVLVTVCSALMGLFAVFFYFSLTVVNSFNFLAVTGHHWAHFQNEALHSVTAFASSEKDEHYDNYLKNLKLSSLLKSARVGTLKENPVLYLDSAPVIREPGDFHNLRELSFFLQQYGQQGSLKKVVEKWSEGDNKMAVLSDLATELREDIKKNEMVSEKREYYRIRLDRLQADFAAVEADFFIALNESHSGFSSTLIWLNLIVLGVLVLAAAAVGFFIARPLLRDLKALREAAQEIEFSGHAVNDETVNTKVPDFSFFVECVRRIKAQLTFEMRDRERAQNMAGLGMWKWVASSHKMTWSRKVFEILNLPSGLGPSYESFRDRVHPEDRAVFDNLLRDETYTEMKELLVELRLVCNYGGRWQIRYCHILVEAQQSEHGTVISGTIQDITERKSDASRAS